ncbi:MAG: hypothetical protein ABI579_01520, partial [Candidatus Sumerlaeota bacterium]
VMASLKQPVSPNRDDARLQYNNYRDIMKSGDPMKIAKLLRELYILDQADDLKGKEKEIMEQAKKFLCDEVAYIRQVSKATVTEQINEALRQMYKKKVSKDKERAKKSNSGVSMGILGYQDDEVEEEEEDDDDDDDEEEKKKDKDGDEDEDDEE